MNRENDGLPLRSLPKEKASELFTVRVMARVRELDRRSRPPLRAAVLMSGGGLILLALALGVMIDARQGASISPPVTTVASDAEPLSARESIESDATHLEPVIYVGSTDHYDFYLDLRPIEGTAAGVRPASYRGDLQPGL